jgi:Flp pilus assembly protein TadD
LAQSTLAGLYEVEGRYEPAQERYRAILRLRPRDPVALNNLAFSLAERSNRPAEALPLAQQAYALGRGAPLIADTLGWVHYKLGDLTKAASFLQEAVLGVPARADIRIRLALVLAAQQRWTDAERELTRAKESDPGVERTEPAKRLSELLERRPFPGRP